MDIEERLQLIKTVGEEIITENELRNLLETRDKIVAYDGFEPSGHLHIAQGLMRAINIEKMLKAGIHFKIWVADWFAWMNNKMSGDLEKIRRVGEYQIETWKACGLDIEKVEFLWSKDVMADETYWRKVVEIARTTTVRRIIRCSQIMGRRESESLSAAQIFYPCMQCADIFHLQADIAQLGMDQRKVNMLAREIGPKIGYYKPVAVHHHMLMGLGQPKSDYSDAIERAIDLKMSKSKPDSAIFMTDSREEIFRKIKKAYCPEKQIAENPILEYCKYIIFEKFDIMEIKRPAKFGGDIEIHSYSELSELYRSGKLHPLDLKNSTAEYIDRLIAPVRRHFDKNQRAKKLLRIVSEYEITR